MGRADRATRAPSRRCGRASWPPSAPTSSATARASRAGRAAGAAGGYAGVGGFVLTRLHLRYGKGDLEDDLVFAQAEPVVGGREGPRRADGEPPQGAEKASINNVPGPLRDPPPVGRADHAATSRSAAAGAARRAGPRSPTPGPTAATNLAFAPRGRLALAQLVAGDVPALEVRAAGAAAPAATPPAAPPPGQARAASGRRAPEVEAEGLWLRAPAVTPAPARSSSSASRSRCAAAAATRKGAHREAEHRPRRGRRRRGPRAPGRPRVLRLLRRAAPAPSCSTTRPRS